MAGPDYDVMRAHIKDAETDLSAAIASMSSMGKMAQLESYILGHLRACQVVLTQAREAIEQANALKHKRLAESEDHH